MATPAHCIYCFENLSAALDDRSAPSLHETETLYSRYLGRSGTENAETPGIGDVDGGLASNKLKTDGGVGVAAPQSTASSPSSADSKNGKQVPSGSSSQPKPLKLFKQVLTNGSTGTGEYPLFVTWNTITKSNGKALRGCIGTFEATPLEKGLKDYALISAFEDHRFRQVSKKELPTLSCAVTLLTDFEPGNDVWDWELGENGIRIAFRINGRRHSATFLPDVATEQGWDKEETLLNLMAKAGWTGRKADWQKVEIELVRYRGKKVSVDYEDYRRFRAWADTEGTL